MNDSIPIKIRPFFEPDFLRLIQDLVISEDPDNNRCLPETTAGVLAFDTQYTPKLIQDIKKLGQPIHCSLEQHQAMIAKAYFYMKIAEEEEDPPTPEGFFVDAEHDFLATIGGNPSWYPLCLRQIPHALFPFYWRVHTYIDDFGWTKTIDCVDRTMVIDYQKLINLITDEYNKRTQLMIPYYDRDSFLPEEMAFDARCWLKGELVSHNEQIHCCDPSIKK